MSTFTDWFSALINAGAGGLPTSTNPNEPGPVVSTAAAVPTIAAGVTAFLGSLADAKLWASVGWIAVGVVLLLVGTVLWAKNSLVPKLPGIR